MGLVSSSDSNEFQLALLAWRTTTRANRFAPAFGFYGRHSRTMLPDARDPAVSITPGFVEARRSVSVRNAGAKGGRALHPFVQVTVLMFRTDIHEVDSWGIQP